MSIDVNDGSIITIEDFMDNLVHYLMPAAPQYNEKMTLCFNNGTKMVVRKDTNIGYYRTYEDDKCVHYSGFNVPRAGNLKVGDSFIVSTFEILGDKIVSGNGQFHSMLVNTGTNLVIQKIVDPADNTVFDGISQHTFEAKMPVPGEIISVADIKNFLVNTSVKMYQYKTVFVYEWNNNKYENNEWRRPDWYGNSSNGWSIVNKWQYTELFNPVSVADGLYAQVSSEDKIKEDQLISVLHIKKILSQMYSVANYDGVEYVQRSICHYNCHSSCHCHIRW